MEAVPKVTTLKQAYLHYAKAHPQGKARSVKTAIVRYLLPYPGLGLDFHIDANKPLSSQQISEGLELAQSLELKVLSDIDKVLRWQEKVFITLNANANVRSVFKCYLKHFLVWCQEQGWLPLKQSEDWSIPMYATNPTRRHNRGSIANQPITNRRSTLPYRVQTEQLSIELQSELKKYGAFWTETNYSDSTRPIPREVEEMTYDLCFRFTLQFLGWLALDKLNYHERMCQNARQKLSQKPDYESDWLLTDIDSPTWLKELHKKYPPIPIQELKLDILISVVDLKAGTLISPTTEISEPDKLFSEENEAECFMAELQAELDAQSATLSFGLGMQLGNLLSKHKNVAKEVQQLNQIIQKEQAKEEIKAVAQDAANKVSQLFNDFMKWLKYQYNPLGKENGYTISTNTTLKFIHALLNLAKFLYREITNSTMHPNYTDIPVIMELRKLRSKEENSPVQSNPVNPVRRSPTWEELGNLLKHLLDNCSPRLHPHKKWNTHVGKLKKQKTVAKDFQRYLVIMFFRLISPDRQHVVRELRVHDTLRLYWINWKTGQKEEAPWNRVAKRYQVYYNTYTKLYYLDKNDAKDEYGNVSKTPQGKAFEWVIDLDATQTKIDQENSYRVPKIYNPELEAWLYGREDYSETWHNWPSRSGTADKNRYRKEQFNWCGYVEPDTNLLLGFRQAVQPNHDFVFSQQNGYPFNGKSLKSFYEVILWGPLGIRSSPHDVRKAATNHYKRKGMTDAESASLARIKSHSTEMQDSSSYNQLDALEKTARASEMIVNEFLEQQGLDPKHYGLAGP